ncbi:MAG TPA: ATP-binding cassette domain-containing protein [bacterium]|nr:ATP-binding cassette domain-containing protein [bacterium]
MIEYQGVWKSFGDKAVLRGIELTVREGETFFVLGKTGAGKTVMIRLLVGLVKSEQGSIRIDGEDVSGLTEDGFQKVRLKCGMVFQLPTLFDSLPVYENVAFGLRRAGQYSEDEIKRRVESGLRRVEIDPAVGERMPDELSFGEQKRVGLARTLALEPRYLLYDEPTTGLDPFTANRISRLIRQLNRDLNTTSIVVSHDMESMVQIADRVGLLWDGRFRFVGTVDEFMASGDPGVNEFKKGLARRGR